MQMAPWHLPSQSPFAYLPGLLQSVPAGNILAIAGLDLAILKSATVASTPMCRPLAPMLFQASPSPWLSRPCFQHCSGPAKRCLIVKDWLWL